MPGVLPLHDAAADRGLQRIDPVGDCPSITVTGTHAATPPLDAVCDACQGAGWVKEAVPYGHPHFGVLFPCACTLAEQARRKTDALVQLSNLEAFREKTFATFNPFVVGLRTIVPQVRTYARRPDGWLTLLGSYGVGKTHLAAAIAHETLERGEGVLFAVVPDLLDHLRTTFSPQCTIAYDEQFDLLRTAPLLILDDLGTESATSWAREKLYQLINHRYNYRLPTVITSNLKPDAIEPRIYSRLCDRACGVLISITASDYRRRPRPG
jgi:DNA replication protein DnaC